MKRVRAILILALAAPIVLGLALLAIHGLEPSYQGKRLGAWLEELPAKSTVPAPGSVIGASSPSPQFDPTVEAASAAVRQIGTNAIPTLLDLLRRRDSRFRLAVTSLLSKQSLIRFRFARDYELRARSLAGFRALGPIAAPAVPKLLKLYRERDDLRRELQDALAAIEPESVRGLAGELDSPHVERRLDAAHILGDWFGPSAEPAVPALVRRLEEDKDTRVRQRAAVSLGRIARMPTLAVPALRMRLNDPDRLVRVLAINAIAEFGSAAESAVPELVKRLEDEDLGVRRCAASCLGKIGRHPDLVVPQLTQRLKETDGSLRIVTLDALAKYGPDARSAVPEVVKLLNDSSAEIRSFALGVLKRIDPSLAAATARE